MINPDKAYGSTLTSPDKLYISANHGGLVARELTKRGYDSAAFFAESGLDLPQINNLAKRMSVDQIVRLLTLAIEKTEDPSIAIKIYSSIQIGDLDALGFAISCSTTYLSFLERLQRFSKYLMSQASIHIFEEPDGYLFLVDIEDADTEKGFEPSENHEDKGGALNKLSHKYGGFNVLLEALGIGFVKLSNDVCQEHILPKKAYFLPSSNPVAREQMQYFFRAEETIDAPFFGIKFGKEIADRKLPLANPQMARLHDEIIIKQLDEIYQNDIVFQVENLIREGLANEKFSRVKVASRLNISDRKLHLMLEQRDTSFSSILLKVRKTLAMQHVREGKLRVNQIGYLLGFTNGSNFTRSFKSWTGYTPNEFQAL